MIFLCFLLAACVIGFLLVRRNFTTIKTEFSNNTGLSSVKTLLKCVTVPVILILFGLFNPFRLERVDAGYVGVKVNLTGDSRGVSKYQYKTGWVIYNRWTSRVHEFPTYQQHIEYDEQDVITKGGFPATIKPSFNYSLKPSNIADMFQSLRLTVKEIEKQWLKTAIVGSVNDIANKWTVDSIFNYREQFEANIVNECNKRVNKWFEISQLRTNIVPPKPITESIVAKTKAIQEVQVAENNRKVAEADAQRKIALARGDSAQAVIAAAGEAEAIKLKQIVITPQYNEYLKIQKWNGQLPQVQTGSGGGILLNLKQN